MQRTVTLAVSRETRREEAVALFLQTPQMELNRVQMRPTPSGVMIRRSSPLRQEERPALPSRRNSTQARIELCVCKACGRMMLWASGRCAREVDQHEESRALVPSNRALDIKEGQAIHVLLRVRRYDRCSIVVRGEPLWGFT